MPARAGGELVNEEVRGDVVALAHAARPAETLARIEAVFQAREQMLEFNVPPLLALESLMVALQVPRRLTSPAAPTLAPWRSPSPRRRREARGRSC